MTHRFASGLAVAALTSVAALVPARALACGGCFAPTGQPSVVTAHRMAVSLSTEETTLWDQFEYAGAPEDFVWVLPVAGDQDVSIELADQSFFDMLAGSTQVTLQGPITGGGGGGGGGFGCGSAAYGAAGAADSESPDVVVYQQKTVGPYETIVVGSEDGATLISWLQDNGYAVPEAMLPTIMHYVDLGMAFTVLRLSPGAGVQQIQPVRVTTPGLMPVFPLRMVAAGVAEEVSIELFIIAEGRWEAASFPNAQIEDDELVYDFADGSFNYDAVAEEKLSANEGRTWLTEYAMPATYVNPQLYEYRDESGWHLPGTDWDHARQHIAEPWITRMRAVLPVSALDSDLMLGASSLGQRPGFINVTNEVNRPSVVPPIVVGPTDARPWQVPLTAMVLAVLALAAVARRRLLSRA